MSSDEDSDASSSSSSSSTSISSVDSDDPHWTLRVVLEGLHFEQEASGRTSTVKGAAAEAAALTDGPHLMLVPDPCTMLTLRLLLRRKLGVQPKETVLRLGEAPPHRIDSTEGMTLSSLGFKDWCTITVQPHPLETIQVGLVTEMNTPKVIRTALDSNGRMRNAH